MDTLAHLPQPDQAFNRADRQLKAKNAFLVFSSEMEEIKQLIKVRARAVGGWVGGWM